MRDARPTIEQLHTLLSYDPSSGKLFWKERSEASYAGRQIPPANSIRGWNTRYAGKEAFTADDSVGYLVGRIFGVNYNSHRIAWALHHNKWPEGPIDHINGNRSDNRIENIRLVSPQENARNSKRAISNKSGTTGVTWRKRDRKWHAHISVARKHIYLGYFSNRDAAIEARKAAEKKLGFHPNHGRAPEGGASNA